MDRIVKKTYLEPNTCDELAHNETLFRGKKEKQNQKGSFLSLFGDKKRGKNEKKKRKKRRVFVWLKAQLRTVGIPPL